MRRRVAGPGSPDGTGKVSADLSGLMNPLSRGSSVAGCRVRAGREQGEGQVASSEVELLLGHIKQQVTKFYDAPEGWPGTSSCR